MPQFASWSIRPRLWIFIPMILHISSRSVIHWNFFLSFVFTCLFHIFCFIYFTALIQAFLQFKGNVLLRKEGVNSQTSRSGEALDNSRASNEVTLKYGTFLPIIPPSDKLDIKLHLIHLTNSKFIINYYNCSGDYRYARALIGRGIRHISL